MTNLQKQLRINAMLEAMALERRSGIHALSRETDQKFWDFTKEAIKSLDPLSEPDLITRAMTTKNLLAAFAIQNKSGHLMDGDGWSEAQQKIIAALADQSFNNSDDKTALELQRWNIINAFSQLRIHGYIYRGEENEADKAANLYRQVVEMIEETVKEDILHQEENAEDLVREI